jgi:hypothetical protein
MALQLYEDINHINFSLKSISNSSNPFLYDMFGGVNSMKILGDGQLFEASGAAP